MPNEELAERVAAVERLTQLFRAERLVHLAVTTIALIILLTTATVLIIRKELGIAALGAMFGSSGLITIAAARLLTMWNQALALVAGRAIGEAK
jgi:hypothetical protein